LENRRRAGLVARRTIAVLVGLAFIFPIYWVFATSVAGPADVGQYPQSLLPHWHWENYTSAWSKAPWTRYFLNTVFIAAVTTALGLTTSLLAGFAFGRMKFFGSGFLFALVLSVLMIPQTVLLIPDYMIAADLGWIDTYWIQIVPWGASVFGIFLIRQFFLSVPEELFEAAELDGAGRLRILWSIGLPMVKPALVIVALNVFMASWNSFLWPSIMAPRNDSVRPIEFGLINFYSANGTDYPELCAAVSFTTLPVLIIFLLLQKYFIAGAYSSAGGVKS
jgi:multiple sugar transport system permease protein